MLSIHPGSAVTGSRGSGDAVFLPLRMVGLILDARRLTCFASS